MAFWIYQYYDENDNLLYVGKTTRDPRARYHEHIDENRNNRGKWTKEQYSQIAKVGIIQADTSADMDFLETYLIVKKRPQFNIMEKNDHGAFLTLDLTIPKETIYSLEDFLNHKFLDEDKEIREYLAFKAKEAQSPEAKRLSKFINERYPERLKDYAKRLNEFNNSLDRKRLMEDEDNYMEEEDLFSDYIMVGDYYQKIYYSHELMFEPFHFAKEIADEYNEWLKTA